MKLGICDPLSSVFTIGAVAHDGKAILDGEVDIVIPNPMQLMQYDNHATEASIFLGEHRLFFPNWSSNVSKFLKLFEGPDFFANRYKRENLEAILLVGDKDGKGLVWGWTSIFKNHGMMLRQFNDNNFSNMNFDGEVNSLSVKYTGAILPKQEGIESTYVSLWSADAEAPLRPYINKILQTVGAEGPFLYDKNTGEDFVGKFVVTPWNL